MLRLERRLNKLDREPDLDVPFDVACACDGAVSARRELRPRRRNVQWRSQTPGLSATTRRVAECIEGMCTVSRRMGFA